MSYSCRSATIGGTPAARYIRHASRCSSDAVVIESVDDNTL